MSTPEPPAPTPSATTCPEHTGKAVYRINSDGRCIGCGKRQAVIAQEPVVPPASAPAATAGPTDEQLSAVLSRALRLKISPVLAAAIREELAARPATTAGTDFPRRNQMLKWTTGERAIQDAVDVVERMGADVRLTDAVILLGKARDRVADFVDGVAPESTVYPPAAPTGEEAEDARTLAGLITMCRDLKARLVPFGASESGWDSAIATLERASAQATELAALRDVQRAMHTYRRAWEDSKVELAALRARVEEIADLSLDCGAPPAEASDRQWGEWFRERAYTMTRMARAALAPRQTTEGHEHG